MKTYTLFQGDVRLKDNCSLSEAYKLIPAGSEIVSGNKTEKVYENNKLVEEVVEFRAIYKTPRGDRFTIIENK